MVRNGKFNPNESGVWWQGELQEPCNRCTHWKCDSCIYANEESGLFDKEVNSESGLFDEIKYTT